MNNDQTTPNENQTIRLETFKERLKKREIWLNGLIDDGLIEKLYVNLIELDSQNNTQPITVIINSGGGLFHESTVATDIMGTIASPVKTIALANACSGGFILFMAGQERIIHDYTCLMMHSAAFGVFDKVPDVKDRLEYLQSFQEKMAKFLSYQTGGKTTPSYWLTLFASGKDKWFSVEEAIALGIAHKVVRRPEMVDPEFSLRRPFTWDINDITRSQL